MRQYRRCRARPHEQPWSHVRSHYLLVRRRYHGGSARVKAEGGFAAQALPSTSFFFFEGLLPS